MREGLTPLRLIVWYSDGTKRGCEATPNAWAGLPWADVQIVQILYDRIYNGKYLQELLALGDYYWWHPETGWACGRARELPADTESQHIKAGRLIDRQVFIAMYNEACEGVPA